MNDQNIDNAMAMMNDVNHRKLSLHKISSDNQYNSENIFLNYTISCEVAVC